MRVIEERNRLAFEEAEKSRKKNQLEESMPSLWNGTDIPCLFDKKISYADNLSSIPLDLEDQMEVGMSKSS